MGWQPLAFADRDRIRSWLAAIEEPAKLPGGELMKTRIPAPKSAPASTWVGSSPGSSAVPLAAAPGGVSQSFSAIQTSSASDRGVPIQLKRRNKRLFKNSDRMTLGQFHAMVDAQDQQLRRQVEAERVPWRRWRSQGDGGQLENVDHVPPSTYGLARQWTHVTHYSALPSIRRTGLDPDRANSPTGLNASSHTSKYVQRDGSLKAVYLGGDEDVGKSMQGHEQTKAGGRVTLHVTIPPEFRYRHLRANRAVISPDSGDFDDHTGGTSAVSFARIPPEYLSLQHPQTGAMVPLTSMNPNDNGDEYDFSPFATAPRSGERLPSNEEAKRSQESLRRRLRQQADEFHAQQRDQIEPPPRTEAAIESPRVAFPIPPGSQIAKMIDQKPQSHQDQNDSDPEWED
ncbi:MAG: hypothetical protein K2W91_08460 [Novosphingobium sp.]|nr:hypothetical protein [Novosphingobium sp.]